MISVIVPAYNVEQYITRSIESVLAQTYTDFELLVVNDGSDDGTRERVLECQKKDARIRLLDEENAGVAAARNYGIEQARGEYITFLDADDFWEKTFLEKTYQCMREGDRHFVYAWAKERYMDGRTVFIGNRVPMEGRLDKFVHSTGELRLPFPTIAMLMDKAFLDAHNIRFFHGIRMSEDTAFIIRILCLTEAYCVPEVLATYWHRENSATTKKWNVQDWAGTVVIFEKLQEFAETCEEDCIRESFRRIRNYRTYRFLLDCLKRGYVQEAAEYRERWRPWLEEFVHGDGKRRDRWKCRWMLRAGMSGLRFLGKV